MEQNELLQPIEHEQAPLSEKATNDVLLSPSHVERAMNERTRMLASLEGSIPPMLQEAIGIKIEREREALLEMIESDARLAASQHKPGNVLDDSYFSKRSLPKTYL